MSSVDYDIDTLNERREEYQNKIRGQMEEIFFLSMELDKTAHLRLLDDIVMNTRILWRLDVKLNQAMQRQDGGSTL